MPSRAPDKNVAWAVRQVPPGVGQRARRYPSSFVLPMRPVVDHFRKTPLGQKKCAPQPAVELCLAGAGRILPILAPRPVPWRWRRRACAAGNVSPVTSLTDRRQPVGGRSLSPKSVTRETSPISRGPDIWISGLFIGNRKSAGRSGVGQYPRGAAPKHRFSAGLP